MIDNDSLYFCDNGALYCGLHLGSSARATLRDISGQTIERVTAETIRCATDEGMTLACEQCGKVAQ